MKLLLLFCLLFSAQRIFSQSASRIDSISENISELLIHREDINKLKYAIKIKSLYPNEDFSKFEDSPAEFMLRMLHGAELELPIIWNELIAELKSLGMENNSIYSKTYFYKSRADNYIVTSVISFKSNYYIFSYNLLKWEKDIYITRFYKEIKKFSNLKEIEANPFIIIQEETEKELKEMEENIRTEETLVVPQKN